MKITTNQSTFHRIEPDDPKFNYVEGFIMIPRAGIEFTNKCPNYYKEIITDCVNRGWLKPVAYVRDTELFWEEFHK